MNMTGMKNTWRGCHLQFTCEDSQDFRNEIKKRPSKCFEVANSKRSPFWSFYFVFLLVYDLEDISQWKCLYKPLLACLLTITVCLKSLFSINWRLGNKNQSYTLLPDGFASFLSFESKVLLKMPFLEFSLSVYFHILCLKPIRKSKWKSKF